MSGANVGNRIFGRTISGSSPDSVNIEFRSIPVHEYDLSNSVPYSWESGQDNIISVIIGYRTCLNNLSEIAFRRLLIYGVFNKNINDIDNVDFGNVFGPGNSTDNAIVRWDGNDGYNIQNSGVIINDDDYISGVTALDLDITISSETVLHQEGRLFYDNEDKTLAIYNDIPGVTHQVGQELYIRVVNKTGSTILNGTVVYISGTQGNRPTVDLAVPEHEISEKVIGLATHDILNNQEGLITTFGLVRGVDTSGWSAGDSLYVSHLSPGLLTNEIPPREYHTQRVAISLNSTNNGVIMVFIEPTKDIISLGDVYDGTPYDGYYLRGTGQFWDGYEFEPDVVAAVLNNTGVPVSVGDSNQEGVAETFSLSDHVHQLSGTVGGDLSGTLPNPTVTDLTITDEEEGSILYFNGLNWVQLPPLEDGYVLVSGGVGGIPRWVFSPKTTVVGFNLTEDVNNTSQWFTVFRSSGGDAPAYKRSGSSSGIQSSNICSPYQVPFNARIIRAVITLKGAGVQNSTVTYPVTYQTELYNEFFSSEIKVGDIDFYINNSYNVGSWAVGDTNYTSGVDLDIEVNNLTIVKKRIIVSSLEEI